MKHLGEWVLVLYNKFLTTCMHSLKTTLYFQCTWILSMERCRIFFICILLYVFKIISEFGVRFQIFN